MRNKDLTQLIDALEKRYHLQASLSNFLKQTLRRKVYYKNEVILKKGAAPEKMYILYEGIALGYYFNEDNEKIGSWFCAQQQFIGNIKTVIRGKGSDEQIVLLKGSVAYYLDIEKAKEWIEYIMENRSLLMQSLHDREVLLNNRNQCRDYTNNLKKIDAFEIRHPLLIDALPQEFLASYLGMTTVWLNIQLGNR